MSNPYSPPETIDASVGRRIARSLRFLSIASFISGFVAFIAYYGYPVFMNPTWYFKILPLLALLACAFGIIAISGPWDPSDRTAFSIFLILLGLIFPVACLVINATLNATTSYGTSWLFPRVSMFLFATIVFWVASTRVHGVSRGRRLACIGYGLGVLQCMTSLVDFLYTEWAT